MSRLSLSLPTALLVLLLPTTAFAQDKPPAGKDDKKPPTEQGEKGDKKGGDKVEFVSQVLPILEKSCVECHKAPHTGPDGKQRRPKGGVIFDSKEGILASKKGKLVVAKKPDDSKMIAAITLPADDEDRMPPAKKGDPLPKEQIDLLKKWIEQGADFGTWTGAAKGKDDKGKDDKKPADGEKKGEGEKKGGEKGHGDGHDELFALGANLEPLSADVKEQLAALHAHLEPVVDGSPLVRVTFLGAEETVTDATVAELAIAAPHIAELVLARTAITDRAGAAIAALPNLVHLDVRETAFGDAGVQQIAAMPNLQSLNLFATRTGDAGATALGEAPALRELFLWQTPVSADTVVALQQQLPHSRIVFAPMLPEPLADEATPARGRRNR